MLAVRKKLSGSWLDAECSGLLAWKLQQKIIQRVKGRKGLFITLTYNREPYEDSRRLYRAQAEGQHVARFMRRLQKWLGYSLRGKWLCKMEFQEGGWVHWHLILLDVTFIDARDFASIWGHGFVNIKSLNKKRALYVCKYVAKGGHQNLPFWIFAERPKSVKIIRVSPGFWEGINPPRPEPKHCEMKEQRQRIPGVYIPIGFKIRDGGALVKTVDGGVFSVKVDPGEFLCIVAMRFKMLASRKGWHWYRMSKEDLRQVLDECEKRAGERAKANPQACEARGGLNLNRTSNRGHWVNGVPWWEHAQYMQEAVAL